MPSAPKLDQEIARARIPVKAARFYSGKLMQEIAASIEKGEKPELLLLKTWNEKRALWEVQIFAIAPQHRIEPVSYATKDPRTWRSTGQIVLTPEAAKRMGFELIRVADATEPVITPLSRFIKFQFSIVDLSDSRELKQVIETLTAQKALERLREKRKH